MEPRICVCCGQPMTEGGSQFSRNPNVCASCSSMADGMEETSVSGMGTFPEVAEAFPLEQIPEKLARDASAERVLSR